MTAEDFTLPGATGALGALRFAAHPKRQNTLALHGWLDNAASFIPLAGFLPACNLVALDFPGHGFSAPRPPGAVYHLIDYVNDTRAFVDALGWTQFDIIAHSLGANIACLYAAAKPQQVRRMVLLDGVGPLSVDESDAPQKLAAMLSAQQQAAQKAAKPRRAFASWRELIEARMRASKIKSESAELLLRRAAKQTDAGIVMQSDGALKLPSPLYMSEAQVHAFLSGVECPVLLIRARNGILQDAEKLRARVARVKNIRVETIDGDHHAHMDEAESVAALVNPFLQ